MRTFHKRPDIFVIVDFAGDRKSRNVNRNSLQTVAHDSAEMFTVWNSTIDAVHVHQVIAAHSTFRVENLIHHTSPSVLECHDAGITRN